MQVALKVLLENKALDTVASGLALAYRDFEAQVATNAVILHVVGGRDSFDPPHRSISNSGLQRRRTRISPTSASWSTR